MGTHSSPGSSPSLGDAVSAILREAAQAFDGPVALIAHDAAAPPRAAACAPVRSPAGEHLATLCVLGTPRLERPSAAKLAALQELAARAALALSRTRNGEPG